MMLDGDLLRSTEIGSGYGRDFISHTLGTRELGIVRVLVEDEERQNCAFIHGAVRDGCLVRVHSRCLYGDVFGSSDCDCGLQLARSERLIREEGAGVMIYLDQEGRSCGLAAKAAAHRFAEMDGIDTFSAYAMMNLPPDPREYSFAVRVLRELGIMSVRLLTNNLLKVQGLLDGGLDVARVALEVPSHPRATHYLRAKRSHGHLLADV